MDASQQPRPPAPPLSVYHFGGFTLDPAHGALSRPTGSEVSLRPKTAEAFRHLVHNAGRVVPREELMHVVWGDVFVTDDRITQCVTEIRRALGPDGIRLLQTLPKRGYLLVAEVTRAKPFADQAAERRQLTLLFCDLAGSTALSARLDPEDIAKFLGDGLLVYFGWPEAHEDDAERSVRARMAAAEAVAQLATPAGSLAVRVGIATGPVVVGDILDSAETRERSVIGETPNLAARLLAKAAPGSIVAYETTKHLTAAMFEWGDLGTSELKGLPNPVRIWRVVGQTAAESRSRALHSRRVNPLIGRDEELELLVRRWRPRRIRRRPNGPDLRRGRHRKIASGRSTAGGDSGIGEQLGAAGVVLLPAAPGQCAASGHRAPRTRLRLRA